MTYPITSTLAYERDADCRMFEQTISRFLNDHASPGVVQGWRDRGIVDRDVWRAAGAQGLLGLSLPVEHGGGGGDFRHEVLLIEQLGWRGIEGWDVTLHNAVIAPYIATYGTDEQKRRWLPAICSGAAICAIAMTESGAGSDLQAIRTSALRDGDHYTVNGSKTFITNGQCADLVIVVVKTDPNHGARGISLLVVETANTHGFERGRNLDKIGREAADTSELFFNDMAVPVGNLLGPREGMGFAQLMEKLPQERLIIAVQAIAAIEHALRVTLDYVKQREAFGKPLIDLQTVNFTLAECKTEATIARVFVDHCIGLHLGGQLDSATASMAKYWVTDLQCSIIDRCLQLFGGYGYMAEYPIAQAYKDARVARIYGGANEIMKLVIARTL